MTFYRSTYYMAIEPLEVVKTQSCFVVLPNGQRLSIDTTQSWIRRTREEAKQACVAYWMQEVNKEESRLAYAKQQVERAKQL